MSSQSKTERQTIADSTMHLAELMKKDPGGIEVDLAAAGENLVGLFDDSTYTSRRFPNINEQKINALKQAIQDISGGVMVLRSSVIGVSARNKDLVPYVTPHGTLPPGVIVFSINWKNIAAFKAWRHGDMDDVTQDDINAATYFLTVEISKLL